MPTKRNPRRSADRAGAPKAVRATNACGIACQPSNPQYAPIRFRFGRRSDGHQVVILPPCLPDGPRASVAVRHLPRLRTLLPDVVRHARILNLIPPGSGEYDDQIPFTQEFR